tara:strand:+ start:1299 stop:1619 length:321 start_codon:yes stop_codon:yes gene_type:complete
MRYEYHRVREGPNFFITYYKNSSRLIHDPKDAWRTLGVAKFTDTGKALKEWCLQMDQEYGLPQRAKWGSSSEPGRPDDSFASEVMAEHAEPSDDEASPNDNTKMVT